MNVSLIIAAGGAGKRFLNGKTPKASSKLFYHLAGKPLLAHTLESFQGIPGIREIILAVPKTAQSWVRTHLLKNRSNVPLRVIPGGKTRAESVWRALQKTSTKSSWIMVHDGARPFPPREAILKLIRKPPHGAGALLARPVVPTLKRVMPGKERVLETVDRADLYEAQTPQLVRRSFLLRAYKENPRALEATDESSLVEAEGGIMEVVSHSGWNVKITTPEDLELARAYMARNESWTMGFGEDLHRLVKARKFYLGGVRIPFSKGPLGHSDGDVLLHAVIDALLGATGLGDIGEWFSDKNPRFKGIRSEAMLAKVLKKIREKGWLAERIDTVIYLERPKLGSLKKKIKTRLAKLLDLTEDHISIKAKTMEGLGPVGEGKAVSCRALVLLRKAE